MRVWCHLLVLNLVIMLLWYCGEASHVKQQPQAAVEMETPLVLPRVEVPAQPVWERRTSDMETPLVLPRVEVPAQPVWERRTPDMDAPTDLSNRVLLHLRIKRHHC